MILDKFLSNFKDRLCTPQRCAYPKFFLVNSIKFPRARPFFIRPLKTGRIMLSPVAGGQRPPFFVRSISPTLSNTMLATIMKLHGWINLIKVECSAQEPNSRLLNFLVFALCLISYLNFVWSISPKLY